MFHRFLARTLVSTLAVVVVSSPAGAEAARPITIELAAGEFDRQGMPVFFELPPSLGDCAAVGLTCLETNREVPVQIASGEPRQAVWMIGERLEAGQTRRYRLEAVDEATAADPAVSLRDDGKTLKVSVAGRPVLVYNVAVVQCPDRQQPCYDRSGFLHPVFSPSGQVVTDGTPPDHFHQHGIMFPWTNATFEGRPVDFWNSKAEQGKVEHVKVTGTAAGPVFASFTAVLDHIDLTAPGGPKRALSETWRVRVYHRTDGFLFDFHSSQACAGASPLVINEYHYGGMAIRGARAWFEPGGGDFLTSQGKARVEGNHTRPHWVDVFGHEDGHKAGVTVFCAPGNFRSPQPVRLHPKKPYFCWSPQVLGPFSIEPGKPYLSDYRHWVHDGSVDVEVAEELWHGLADPPRVSVLER